MFHSRPTIRDRKIVASLAKHAIPLAYHSGNIDQGIVGTHEGINSRFINHQIEGFAWVGHLTHIHHIILQFRVSFRLCHQPHLIDHHFRYVVAHNPAITVLIEFVLQVAVTTTQIQYSTLLAFD